MSQFAAPAAPSAGITWADLNGALLVIEPQTVETGIQTAYGAADAVRAHVYVLDGPQAGTEYEDTLVFPKILQSQLRSRLNQIVLGRLGQGQGKPGQSPPWLLNDPTPADMQVGQGWLNQHTGQQAPAPTQQQPVQQPVQQPSTVPFG